MIKLLKRLWNRWKKPVASKYNFTFEEDFKEPIIIKEPETPIINCQHRGCNERLTLLSYHCKYCHKKHCEKHRLPEEHNCPSPTLPLEMRRKSSSIYYKR